MEICHPSRYDGTAREKPEERFPGHRSTLLRNPVASWLWPTLLQSPHIRSTDFWPLNTMAQYRLEIANERRYQCDNNRRKLIRRPVLCGKKRI
ncbi:hypothetical protein EVAR_93921_1 [Eumeta japonica]|uniref:Uncharacterized protein n=1 Tax=Eumeta variegata TaxID=151549 RepID=A0A4C1TP29_EUMVA|nr:hypothetical protein EVAR_93921_1 [Eumeta japonica]